MKAPIVLSIVIALLALGVAGAGLFWQSGGQPFQFQTLRDETVTVVGQGLYRFDSLSAAAQARAQDVVTLGLGIPLLLISALLAARGSLRGKLLLSGTLAYFLYTYASYAFGVAYNPLFLVYVALFSMSLFAFVLALMSIDVDALATRFSPRLPRRGIAALLFVIGGFLSLAWLGRIAPSLFQDRPPFGLESYTTLVIQVLDLGLLVPLAILAGVLLLRRKAWGYLLTSVALIKLVTMGTAVSAMAAGLILAGETVSPVEVVVFPALTLFSIGMTVVLLRNVEGATGAAMLRQA